MCGGEKQLLHKILLFAGECRNAAAAPALGLVGVCRLALDIARMGKGEHAGLLWNKVLNIYFTRNMGNFGAALVAVLFAQFVQLIHYKLQHTPVVCQRFAPVGYFGVQLAQLIFYFQNFQPCQLAKAEGTNGGGLRLVKIKFVHHGLLCLCLAALAGADGGDNFVHNIGGAFQALQNMRALFCLFQIMLRAAAHHGILKIDILLQHVLQRHYLGHATVQRKHDDAHGVLKLCIAI